jgi:hypothetical protein
LVAAKTAAVKHDFSRLNPREAKQLERLLDKIEVEDDA